MGVGFADELSPSRIWQSYSYSCSKKEISSQIEPQTWQPFEQVMHKRRVWCRQRSANWRFRSIFYSGIFRDSPSFLHLLSYRRKTINIESNENTIHNKRGMNIIWSYFQQITCKHIKINIIFSNISCIYRNCVLIRMKILRQCAHCTPKRNWLGRERESDGQIKKGGRGSRSINRIHS